MNRILILFAHPRFEQSRSNAALVKQIPDDPNVTFHDLYEEYPDFNIDVDREKTLLLNHDIIIWHHPMYWYSAPPILKQWIDMVLEFSWAYGPGGNKLKDKLIFNVFTSGGRREVYCRSGYNHFTIREFFLPFQQTATLCQMLYLPPFAVHGTHKLSDDHLFDLGIDYRMLLNAFKEGEFDTGEMETYEYMNEWITDKLKVKS